MPKFFDEVAVQSRCQNDQARLHHSPVRQPNLLQVLACFELRNDTGDKADIVRDFAPYGGDHCLIRNTIFLNALVIDDTPAARADNVVISRRDARHGLKKAEPLQEIDLRAGNFFGAEFRRINWCLSIKATRWPARPRTAAAVAPPIPAPTIATSTERCSNPDWRRLLCCSCQRLKINYSNEWAVGLSGLDDANKGWRPRTAAHLSKLHTKMTEFN